MNGVEILVAVEKVVILRKYIGLIKMDNQSNHKNFSLQQKEVKVLPVAEDGFVLLGLS